MTFSRALLLIVSLVILGQALVGSQQPPSRVKREKFGVMPDGQAVEQFTLTNANGIELKAISYGGIITSLRTPDRSGKLDDIVLGFDRLEGYLSAATAIEHARVLEYLARLEWRVRAMAPDASPPDSFLVDKHYLRKHGPGAYYGQK